MGYQSDHQIEYKTKGLSGSTLKIIAIITMFIDHLGAGILEQLPNYSVNNVILYQTDYAMRMIGRIAFPIFCFLLVEGFLHTRNVYKYVLRLFIFAIISEVPFDLAFKRTIFETSHQNVFFTLLIGLIALIIIQKYENNVLIRLVTMLGGMYIAEALATDYAAFGVVYIILLYTLHNNAKLRNIFGSIAIIWEITAPIAFIPISKYNGERGFQMKYFFYVFYPTHLLFIYAIEQFFVGMM